MKYTIISRSDNNAVLATVNENMIQRAIYQSIVPEMYQYIRRDADLHVYPDVTTIDGVVYGAIIIARKSCKKAVERYGNEMQWNRFSIMSAVKMETENAIVAGISGDDLTEIVYSFIRRHDDTVDTMDILSTAIHGMKEAVFAGIADIYAVYNAGYKAINAYYQQEKARAIGSVPIDEHIDLAMLDVLNVPNQSIVNKRQIIAIASAIRSLNERQRYYIAYMKRGYSLAQIALHYGVSKGTIEHHIRVIRFKIAKALSAVTGDRHVPDYTMDNKGNVKEVKNA